MGVAIQFTGDASQYIAEWNKVTGQLREAGKEATSWAKAANAGVAGAEAQLKRYSEEWLKHQQTINASTKQYEQITQKVGAFGASMGANRQAMMQWGYMIQDVSATVGTMGLSGAIKSVGDNAVYMAAMLGGEKGPIIAFWTSVGVAALTTIAGMNQGLEKQIDKLKDYGKIINDIQIKIDRAGMMPEDVKAQTEFKANEAEAFKLRQLMTTGKERTGMAGFFLGGNEPGMADAAEQSGSAYQFKMRDENLKRGDYGSALLRGLLANVMELDDKQRMGQGKQVVGFEEQTAFRTGEIKLRDLESKIANHKAVLVERAEREKRERSLQKWIDYEREQKRGYQDEREAFADSTKRGGPMYGKYTKKEIYEETQRFEGLERASETIIRTNEELMKNLRNNPRADGANG